MHITISGGSESQQASIMAAHASTLTTLKSAQIYAASAEANFVLWFGATGSTVQQRVSAIYTTAITALESWQIIYDLSNDTYPLMLAPNITIMFNPNQDQSIAAGLWSGYWSLAAIDPVRANAFLQTSVAHQAINLSGNNAIYDQLGAIGKDEAQALAKFDPEAALVSLRNYLWFAFQTTKVGGAFIVSPNLYQPVP